MDFFDTVRQRRSIRRYTKDPVPEGVIHKALDAALLAPNSSNMQPWEFYWVRTPEKKGKLVEACLSQGAAATAPELIVVVCRADTWRRNARFMLDRFAKEPQSRGAKQRKDYYEKIVPLAYTYGWFNVIGLLKYIVFTWIGFFRSVPRSPVSRNQLFQVLHKTTALACENFMLAITAQGYGSCPMEGFDEVRVKRLLGLGRQASVNMVISVGKIDPAGIFGDQIRFDKDLFVFEV